MSPSETTYEIRDVDGSLVAEHVRVDRSDGSKEFWWRRNGKPGLQGLHAADLPLYGVHRLPEDLDTPIVVVEGEKAADALLDRGVAAVATARRCCAPLAVAPTWKMS